jgi:transcriptional regulator with XRE-family HTH domain
MRTVQFEPRSFYKEPKLFGKPGPTLALATLPKSDDRSRSRQAVAEKQHEIAVKVRAKAPLPIDKAELASNMGITPATLGRLLRGEVVMQIETMFFLASWLRHEVLVTPRWEKSLAKEREALETAIALLKSGLFELAKKERDVQKRKSR